MKIKIITLHKAISLITLLFFLNALLLSSCNQTPTSSEKWGTPQQLKNAKVLVQSGMKDNTYSEASKSLVEELKNVKGVVGVETFADSKTFKIYYDPAIISEEGIKEAMFTPQTILLHEPTIQKIGVMEIGVQNYFDSTDEYYMTELLSSESSIFGFTSIFGEPVRLKIYFNTDSLQPSNIMALIETEEVNISDDKNEPTHKLVFEVQDEVAKPSYVSLQEFYEVMAPLMDDKFNDFETYNTADLSVYEIPIAPFNGETYDQVGFLESHLSADEGVVGFKTIYKKDTVIAHITYVKSKTTADKVFQMLNAKKLKVYYNDSTSDEINNAFKFEKPGRLSGN